VQKEKSKFQRSTPGRSCGLFVDSLSKKQLQEIREEFLDGFADGYWVDRSDPNEAYVGFLEGCMLDWYEGIWAAR
jgi:hypothetical protein